MIVEPSDDIKESLLTMQDLYQDQINDESLLNLTIACAVGAISKGSNEQIKNHGLGLLRSEFLFLSSSYEPSEDEMTDCFIRSSLLLKGCSNYSKNL